MRAYTLTELINLTRAELFALRRQVVDALAQLPEGSPERFTALATLRDIRLVLARVNSRQTKPRREAKAGEQRPVSAGTRPYCARRPVNQNSCFRERCFMRRPHIQLGLR